MSFLEAIGAGSKQRSTTSQALQNRLVETQAQAVAPSVHTDLNTAVSQSSAMESARLMMESRSNETHVPMSGRPTLSQGASFASLTAAYLTEMRLTQELEQVREKLSQ